MALDSHNQGNHTSRNVDDSFSHRKDTSNHHIGKSPFVQADAGLGTAPPLRVAGHTNAEPATL